MIICRLLIVVCLGFSFCWAEESPLFKQGDRVVFIGDSNTYAAHYVNYIEAAMAVHRPDLELEILNVGLPSETASGLSEPAHPFPRPCVHERLERVLQKTEPDVVIAAYGMNDGMYYPPSAERFTAYREGMTSLIKKVHDSGAKLILLTPPPFDPKPMAKKGVLLPADAAEFSWKAIYEDYDSVLAEFSDWLTGLNDERVELVIDVRTPMVDYTTQKRRSDPDFVMSGDGVHFDEEGHRIIADRLLSQWKIESEKAVPAELEKLVAKRQVILRDAWLTHCGHKRPGTRAGLPLKEAQSKAAAIQREIDQLLP
ncbi:MAG: SGNH/GDSL hydrolase family protein [Verrucomicrobiales bacterium]|nr:SGNH/GDSL hydrolase family protein [Verrucomicrobiales bacterium]